MGQLFNQGWRGEVALRAARDDWVCGELAGGQDLTAFVVFFGCAVSGPRQCKGHDIYKINLLFLLDKSCKLKFRRVHCPDADPL